MPPIIEIAYFTDDVSAMATFYERLLGEAPVARSDDMAIFMAGGTKLFIHKSYAASDGELPPETHVALGVENVDAACARLQQQGLALVFEPRTYYWGRSAYLRDPDGHLIELNQSAPLA